MENVKDKNSQNVNIRLLESWPSGRRRTLGKRVEDQTSRGFESHTLRRKFRRLCESRQDRNVATVA